MDHHENLIAIHQSGNWCETCQGSGWCDPTNRDVCCDCNGSGEWKHLDEVVTPAWLDSQSWLQKQDNMDNFKTWIAFSEPKSRKRLEVFWHSPCDHVGEWSTLYIGRDVTKSNPTVRQVLAFKHAFELMEIPPAGA